VRATVSKSAGAHHCCAIQVLSHEHLSTQPCIGFQGCIWDCFLSLYHGVCLRDLWVHIHLGVSVCDPCLTGCLCLLRPLLVPACPLLCLFWLSIDVCTCHDCHSVSRVRSVLVHDGRLRVYVVDATCGVRALGPWTHNVSAEFYEENGDAPEGQGHADGNVNEVRRQFWDVLG
jgi:hypothetical protein